MQFWIRHILLLLLCVVVPLAGAFYFDTESEISRAKQAGAKAVRSGSTGLSSQLKLEAHQISGAAISLAQKVSEGELLENLGSRYANKKRDAITALSTLVDGNTPKQGFVWFLEHSGAVFWKNGMTELSKKPESMAGHPLYLQTQLGYALDGLWPKADGGVAFIGAAPVLKDGAAYGAIIVGRPIDRAMVSDIATSLGAGITMIVDGKLVTSTLEPAIAQEVIGAVKESSTPVHSGRLSKPLAHNGRLPFLPLLIDRNATGLAYTSMQLKAPGPYGVRWVLSVRSADELGSIAERQEVVLGGMVASLLLALLIGLINHRTFVSPIKKVAQHLSDLQQGRGEMEMPEGRVSRPFRRLVRLINMTVQKMPSRSFSAAMSSMDLPIASLPAAPQTSDLLGMSTPLPHSDGSSPISTIPKSEVRPPVPPSPSAPASSADLSSFPVAPSAPETPNSQDLQAGLSLDAPKTEPFTLSNSGKGDDEAAAVAEAIASMTLPPTAPAMEQDDHASAIADAIASLDGSGVKSAAEIRGRTMSSSDSTPSPFGDGAVPTPDSAVRGGGSLALNTYAGVPAEKPVDAEGFTPEETVVAPVQEDLLAKSARDDMTDMHMLPAEGTDAADSPDMTVVATVPADLLAQSAGAEPEPPPEPDPNGLDAADREHFKDVYDRFIEMRRRCGEPTQDLAFDRFMTKLTKNRMNLIKKYSCRTVRFQVYEKGGKAALKATPVRAR